MPVPGEARLAAEPFGAGSAADDHRRRHRPDARLFQELRGVSLKQHGELVEHFLLLFADFVDPAQLLLLDPKLRGFGSCPSHGGQTRKDSWALQPFRTDLGLDWRDLHNASASG